MLYDILVSTGTEWGAKNLKFSFFYVWVEIGKRFVKRTGFGPAGLYFVMSCRVGYGYWARVFGPWAVRVAQK